MLELNSVRFEQGLNNATSMAENAMKRVEGAANLAKVALGGLAGAVSLGGIVAFVKNTIEATANLKDLAENTNATVEQLSALAMIAKRSGQDMDSVVVGLQKLSRQMVAAAGGSKEAVQSFATFGITAAEVRAKLNDPAAMLLLLAQRSNEFGRSAVKTDAMMALMGRGGADLGKFMGDLAEQTELVGNRTTEQAERAEKFEKAMRRLGEGVDKVAKGMVIDLLPALEKLLPLMKTAAELAALWFGAFVVGPKVIAGAVVAYGVLAGLVQTSTLYFAAATTTWEAMTTSLYGVSVAARVASGVMGALTVAAGTLFAAFAGWKIGEYLRDNFLEAQLAGIAMVQGLMKAWEYIKFGFEVVVEDMKTLWGSFIEMLGTAFSRIPGFGDAGKILQALGQSQKGKQIGEIAAERDRRIAADAAIFSDMADQAIASFDKVEKADAKAKKKMGTPPDTKGVEEYRKKLEALLNRLEGNGDGVNAKFWEELAMLNKEFAKKDPERYAKLVGELIRATEYGKKATHEMMEAAKANNEAFDAAFDAMEKERLATESSIKAWREKAEAVEFETSVMGLSSAEREKAIVLHDLEKNKVGLTATAYAQLRQRIEEALASREATRTALQGQVDFWKSITDVAHQTWNSIADGSKNLWQRVKDTAKNIFFDWLYQMTAKKWMFNIITSVSGQNVAEQVLGASAGSGGVLGSLSGLGNLASGANTLYGLYSGGLASTVGSGIGYVGGLMGSSTLTGFAAGMKGATLASSMAGPTTAGAGGAMGAGAAAASWMPWVAAAIAVLSMVDWGGGTPHKGAVVFGGEGGATTSPATRADLMAMYANAADFNQFDEKDFTRRYQQGVADALAPVAGNLGKLFNSITAAAGAGSGYQVGLGFSADGDDKSRGRFSIIDAAGNELTDFMRRYAKSASEGMQQFALDAHAGLLAGLREVDLGKTINDFLDASLTSSGDLLQKLTQEQSAAMVELMAAGTLDDIIDAMHLTRMSFADVATSVTNFLPAMQQAEAAFQAVRAQIADIRAASSQMFVDSARSIRLDVLDNQGKYDFFKQEVERYRDVMMSLTDATLIQDYAAKINQTLMASWGVLDDTQKQASVDKYEKLFAEADQLTSDRLAQAEQVAADERLKWAESVGTAINQAMDRAAAKIAAAVPQRIEVGVNVSGNVAASSEVVAY